MDEMIKINYRRIFLVFRRNAPFVNRMDKNLQKELEQKLREEKAALERDLSQFAARDPKNPENWDAKFPVLDDSGASYSDEALETSAEEITEYETRREEEHALESRLKEANDALKRMERGAYGVCAKCGKEISEERLRANPAAAGHTECE